MSELAIQQHTENVAHGVAVQPGKVLAYLGLDPNDPRSQAVVAVAQRYDLDPLLKHVIVIPKGGVYITRDGLLHVAHRSGQLDGIVVEQEPTLSEDKGEWVSRVSVYRKDMRHPFTFPGRYPVNGGNRDYAQEMSLKAAEAHSLRRAFDVTGLPALEEQRPAEAAQKHRGLGEALAQTSGPEDAPDAPVVPSVERSHSGPESVTAAQLKKVGAAMGDLGLKDRKVALTYVKDTIGRDVGSRNELTKAEAHTLIEALESDIAERDEAQADKTTGEIHDVEVLPDPSDGGDPWAGEQS